MTELTCNELRRRRFLKMTLSSMGVLSAGTALSSCREVTPIPMNTTEEVEETKKNLEALLDFSKFEKLVLDEATSSVDNETEAAIQRSLEQIVVGRTTIIIAHRLSTVRAADRIYVIESGEVKEQGRHEDLLDRDGIYASLWRVQTGMGIHL